MREFRKRCEFPKSLNSTKSKTPTHFRELRLIKSPYEIKVLQHAIDITTEAQMRSMAMVGKPSGNTKCRLKSNTHSAAATPIIWGYPSIVGCGPNATTLHYVESQGEVKQGDLC